MAMKNISELKELRERYDEACEAYVKALLELWEGDAHYGYWIADEVGTVYSYGEYIFINMEDIIYCVENGVSEEEYIAWQDYCTFAHEYGQSAPNFVSWCKGCPRLSKEEQDKLISMKRELNEAIKNYKEKY